MTKEKTIENFYLAKADVQWMNGILDKNIEACYEAFTERRKNINEKLASKDRDEIEKEFKDPIRKNIYMMLGKMGLGDMEEYATRRDELAEGGGPALQAKLNAVDIKLKTLVKSIDTTFAGLEKLADVAVEKGGKQQPLPLPKRQKGEFIALMVAATISLALTLSALVLTLNSTNLTAVTAGTGATLVGAATTVFTILVAALQPTPEQRTAYMYEHSIKARGGVAFQGTTAEEELKGLKGIDKSKIDIKELFKENIAELRMSLRELVSTIKVEGKEEGKDNAKDRQAEATPEAAFVKYLETKEKEMKQGEGQGPAIG